MLKQMNKIKSKIKAFFACSYRLAVWTKRGTCIEYKADKRWKVFFSLKQNETELKKFESDVWTLYKTGRFFLPEREVQRSDN